VTSEFIALRSGTGCQLIDTNDLVSVHRVTEPEDQGAAVVLVAEMVIVAPIVIPTLPVVGIMELARQIHRPLTGEWESADGTTLSIYGAGAERQSHSVERGSFRLEKNNLRLDSGRVLEVEFDCEHLRIDGDQLTAGWSKPAAKPIIGRWAETEPRRPGFFARREHMRCSAPRRSWSDAR
jgi:hypothetical protein